MFLAQLLVLVEIQVRSRCQTRVVLATQTFLAQPLVPEAVQVHQEVTHMATLMATLMVTMMVMMIVATAMMTKQKHETYVVENLKNSGFKAWLNTRAAKVTAISVGAALALGSAFTAGAVLGKFVSIDEHRDGFAQKFDRDGDSKFNGQLPPRPNQAPDGDRDGFDPNDNNQAPQSTTPNKAP